MNDVKAQVKEFIIQNYLFGDKHQLDENSSLLEEGIIDSQGVLELVFFLEENLGISVDDDELIPDNLDSVCKIADFVKRKAVMS